MKKRERDESIIHSLWFDVYSLLGNVCFLNGLWKISNWIIDYKYWLIITIIIIIIDKWNQIYKYSSTRPEKDSTFGRWHYITLTARLTHVYNIKSIVRSFSWATIQLLMIILLLFNNSFPVNLHYLTRGLSISIINSTINICIIQIIKSEA